MRFWSPITYTLLTTGVIACSVYDASLLPEEPEQVITGSGGASTTTSSSSGGPMTGVGGVVIQTSNSGSQSGSSGGTGGEAGSGGSPSTTTGQGATGGDGGSGGGSGGQSTTTTDDGSGGAMTTTGEVDGTGGSGGNPPMSDPTLIDDLEDGNSKLKTPDYTGYWYTAVDETGTGEISPAPGSEIDGVEQLDPPRGDSTRAMHVSGQWSGDNWAAAVGFSFLKDDAVLDASMFSGISFWVKSDVATTNVTVQIMMTTITDDAQHEYELSNLHTLSSTWQKITINFADNPDIWHQPDWRTEVVPFDPSKLYKVQFQFTADPFDLWIDDVRFEE